jgi:hypothetical protein
MYFSKPIRRHPVFDIAGGDAERHHTSGDQACGERTPLTPESCQLLIRLGYEAIILPWVSVGMVHSPCMSDVGIRCELMSNRVLARIQ